MADSCDILISGGGVAGLTAACAFGDAGFRVICTDPSPPVTKRDAVGADLRTTAILQPGRTLMDEVGLWPRLAPHAAPLQIMRIIEAGQTDGDPPVIRDFDAADISDAPFGWNLPNWLLRREMVARLDDLETVDFRPGLASQTLLTRESEARVGLSDGTQVRARLVIAADGRTSTMRQAAGIGVRTTRYGQQALVCALSHDNPHDNVSTEVHRSGGPFTLVPLPEHDGRPCSALVWMDHGAQVRALMAMETEDFNAAMTDRSGGIMGPLTLISARQAWPIISQVADRLVGQRLALMAEAAHVIPPIGAQGLNMSLGDLRALLDLATADRDGLGGQKMLDAYARTRALDIRMRVGGVDLLNRASIAGMPGLQAARGAGLRLLHDLTPVRRAVMKLGLGLR